MVAGPDGGMRKTQTSKDLRRHSLACNPERTFSQPPARLPQQTDDVDVRGGGLPPAAAAAAALRRRTRAAQGQPPACGVRGATRRINIKQNRDVAIIASACRRGGASAAAGQSKSWLINPALPSPVPSSEPQPPRPSCPSGARGHL